MILTDEQKQVLLKSAKEGNELFQKAISQIQNVMEEYNRNNQNLIKKLIENIEEQGVIE